MPRSHSRNRLVKSQARALFVVIRLIARRKGWRICRHCGNCTVPPVGTISPSCIDCTRLVPTLR